MEEIRNMIESLNKMSTSMKSIEEKLNKMETRLDSLETSMFNQTNQYHYIKDRNLRVDFMDMGIFTNTIPDYYYYNIKNKLFNKYNHLKQSIHQLHLYNQATLIVSHSNMIRLYFQDNKTQDLGSGAYTLLNNRIIYPSNLHENDFFVIIVGPSSLFNEEMDNCIFELFKERLVQ